MATTLRWGILSTARIADALVRAIRASSDNELIAVASRDAVRAVEWAARRDVPHAFGSYEEMLASDVIDAVYIALPNSMHKEWATRAAEMGKHVLCEKPLALNAAEVEQMIAAAREYGVQLMEAFMYRFHPQYQEVKRMLADNAIGEIKILRASFEFLLDRPADIRLDKALGGGSLLDVGCYDVNVCRLIAQAEPVAVQAEAGWTPGDVDETFAAVLEFPKGVLAAIDCSFRAHYHQWFGISGTEGHIGLAQPFKTGGEPTTILYDHGDERTQSLHGDAANSYQLMVEEFANAVRGNRPPSYPPESSLTQAKVLDGLVESARTGRRVILEK
ncbi:MAG: Gfo/Idh/MocA family protein [Rudaea sp.]